MSKLTPDPWFTALSRRHSQQYTRYPSEFTVRSRSYSTVKPENRATPPHAGAFRIIRVGQD